MLRTPVKATAKIVVERETPHFQIAPENGTARIFLKKIIFSTYVGIL